MEKNTNMLERIEDDFADDIKNWRPLCISNASYRIFTAILAREINAINRKTTTFNPNQKEFIQVLQGVSEHNLNLQEIFADAQKFMDMIGIKPLEKELMFLLMLSSTMIFHFSILMKRILLDILELTTPRVRTLALGLALILKCISK